jgi:hypothetical protein
LTTSSPSRLRSVSSPLPPEIVSLNKLPIK